MTSVLFKIAQALGLSPGADGGPARPLTMEEVEKKGLLDLFVGLSDTPLSQEDGYGLFANFTASYLPSLIRTVTENAYPDFPMPHECSESSWWEEVLLLLAGALSQLSFSVWLREDPTRAVEFYLSLSRMIAGIPDYMFWYKPLLDEHWGFFVLQLSFAFELVEIAITTACLSLHYLPILDASTRAGFKRVAPHIRLIVNSEAVPVVLPGMKSWPDTLEGLSEGLQVILDVSREKLDPSWWGCELKHERRGEEGRRVVCVPLKNGEELKACSRCRAVRYCSKEHQKIDWKAHKRICFKPCW